MMKRTGFNRRDVLKAGTVMAAMAALPGDAARADGAFSPRPGNWRTFQTVTRLEIARPAGIVQAWMPLPAISDAAWFRPEGSTWTTNAKSASKYTDPKYGAGMLHAIWAEGELAPVIEVTSKFATRDRFIDLTQPVAAPVPVLSAAEYKLYTAGTELIPVDGIVKETADKISAGATGDLDKARRIYEWVVENTVRNAKTRGCGLGDIASMLRTNTLSGRRPEAGQPRAGFRIYS